MILSAVIGLLCTMLIWVTSLLPQFNINSIDILSTSINAVWTQAYSWSGVFPVSTVLMIFQTAVGLLTVFIAYSLVMLILNIVRGSGA